MMTKKHIAYKLIRIRDHSNAAPDIGLFDSLNSINEYVEENCADFNGQLVLRSDGSVVIKKREIILIDGG